jgi:transglutaminase-like putative cysteine protease
MIPHELVSPGRFIDSDTPEVIAFARRAAAGGHGEIDTVVSVYRAVRDGIIYDPYVDFSDEANFRASKVLAAGRGFCVGKSALLAAAARALGIPARVGYADVRNHLTSPKLYQLIKTDVFLWHSYTDLYVNDAWVKATPAFDSVLCQRLGLQPLDFDGRHDSLFHPFDRQGRRHMEYLRDRGTFADVPFAAVVADFRAAYPSLMNGTTLPGDFRTEAVAGAN